MLDRGEAIRKLALNLARYTGLAPLARPFVGGVGAILMLHRVTAHPGRPDSVNRHLAIHPAFLDRLIREMKEDGYRFVTLCEAVAGIATKGRERFAVVTADDGYRDNLYEALPVLERHGVPFTIYVAPALTDGTACLWWEVIEEVAQRCDRVKVSTPGGPIELDASTPARKYAVNSWLHDYFASEVSEADRHRVLTTLAAEHGVDPLAPSRAALMSWDEVSRAAAHPLVSIGAHTVNHFMLRRLDEATALQEMLRSADILEAKLGVRPRHLAYPYGYASAVGGREVALAARAGFASAVTTRHGVLQQGHAGHVHALPRISVNGRYQRVAHIRTMLSGVTTPMVNAGKVLVTV
ncbi:MAG: polysaccharide deacetylase family protein [Rhizobiaceae bacterium]|nr:polysaccharide deacetylase family protein [Rhizobiaceae bacterium]